MGETSKIAWTEATWNPMTGCAPDFECWDRCYARAMLARFNKNKSGFFDPTFYPKRLTIPKNWKGPKVIFVCSMGDLFCNGMDMDATIRIFQVMQSTPQHKYLILTKRPGRMRTFIHYLRGKPEHRISMPLRNVFLGVSICREKDIYRVPELLSCHGFMHFISMEPLLECVDISQYINRGRTSYIDWVIVGGESGTRARPMHPAWVDSLWEQCHEAGTPFFFKQWGTWKPVEQPMFNAPQVYSMMRDTGKHELCTLKQYAEHPDIDNVTLFQKVGKEKAGELFHGEIVQQYPEQLR